MSEYAELFARTKDEYIKERVSDVRDVIVRLSGHLSEVLKDGAEQLPDPLILVADELLPSQVVMLGNREVRGIITQAGGQTSHAAILARSRGIPAVSGLRGLLRQVKNGDTIVVDGRDGHVEINPDPETLAAFRKLQREFFDLKDHLAENRDQARRSPPTASKWNCWRTSITFWMPRRPAPWEARASDCFARNICFSRIPTCPMKRSRSKRIGKSLRPARINSITIRTLDLGGDKTIPYLGHAQGSQSVFGLAIDSLVV